MPSWTSAHAGQDRHTAPARHDGQQHAPGHDVSAAEPDGPAEFHADAGQAEKHVGVGGDVCPDRTYDVTSGLSHGAPASAEPHGHAPDEAEECLPGQPDELHPRTWEHGELAFLTLTGAQGWGEDGAAPTNIFKPFCEGGLGASASGGHHVGCFTYRIRLYTANQMCSKLDVNWVLFPFFFGEGEGGEAGSGAVT